MWKIIHAQAQSGLNTRAALHHFCSRRPDGGPAEPVPMVTSRGRRWPTPVAPAAAERAELPGQVSLQKHLLASLWLCAEGTGAHHPPKPTGLCMDVLIGAQPSNDRREGCFWLGLDFYESLLASSRGLHR